MGSYIIEFLFLILLIECNYPITKEEVQAFERPQGFVGIATNLVLLSFGLASFYRFAILLEGIIPETVLSLPI